MRVDCRSEISLGVLSRAPKSSGTIVSLCLQRRKEFSERQVIDRSDLLEWDASYLQAGGWEPLELTGLRLYNQRKSGRKNSVFLEQTSIFHYRSSSRLSRRVFLFPHAQARFTKYLFLCLHRVYFKIINLIELTEQDVGLMPSLFYGLGASLMFLLHGFLLSKPAWFWG